MRIDWKSRRTQLVVAVVLAGLLVWSIADGALRTWGQWDYIGWWVLLPLFVLLVAALVTFLARAWGKRS
jgi:phosphate/sulfate permease